MAEVIKLPKGRPSKTSKKHRLWTKEDRAALLRAYKKLKGRVPKDWYKQQAEKYDRTVIAIMKQLHPSHFKKYPEPANLAASIITKPIDVDSPLAMAKHTFIGRWKEENGDYWIRLYGQWNPVGLHAFIRAANVIRKARGEPLIRGSVEWEP